MSFLLDTDICSAYLKDDPVVVLRVTLHYGGLNVSVITVGELVTWARRANALSDRLKGVQDLLRGATVLDVSLTIAEKFGEIRAGLLDRGITVGEMDLQSVSKGRAGGVSPLSGAREDRGLTPPARPDRELGGGRSIEDRGLTPLARPGPDRGLTPPLAPEPASRDRL